MGKKVEVKLPRVKCNDCGHIWNPRVVQPTWCPKCLHTDIMLAEDNKINSNGKG